MPYGLQSDEDSQLASILERLQLLEAENASLKQSISQAQSQAQSQPQEAPQHIAPPLPQYRQEPSVSLPDKFNGNRLKLRTFLNQLELVFLINPSRYNSEGIKVATAGTLLTDVAASWFNPSSRTPTTTTPPSTPGRLSRPC
ncbi:hypothetical protein BASA81_018302 [Batrachochytrium salamandrivorans]|nr:hypothetical protein BASA81_018302 [Batrachochytrium salamandrivorans]